MMDSVIKRESLFYTGASPLLGVLTSLDFKLINPSESNVKYCHFYYPLSGYHLRKDICQLDNKQHVTEKINGQMLNDIKTGKCLLIIDNSPEGHIDPRKDYFIEPLQDIVSYLDPALPVLVIDQNRALKDSSECNPRFIDLQRRTLFLNYDFHIKKLALEIADTSNMRPFASYDQFIRQSKSPFLCLFGTPRAAKVALYKHLLDSRLIAKSRYSYQGFAGAKSQSLKNSVVETILSSFCRQFFPLAETKKDVEQSIDCLPCCKLDTIGGDDMNHYAIQMPYELFDITHCSLVVETDFSSSSMQRITEKSFKAFAAGHPSVVFGNPFSIKTIRELGFDVFDDIIDHSYDSIADPSLRFEVVISELGKLVERIEANPSFYSRQIYKRAKDNYDHAHSSRFLSRYGDLYDVPLVTSIRHALRE